MAEAIAISVSAKLAMALSHSAAVSLSNLFGVGSDITATAQELEVMRAFLRSADSQQGMDALATSWIKQVRDAAFELEDVADECSYLSGNGRSWVKVRSWLALSRRLRRARERLHQLSAAKELYGIRLADGGPAVRIATVNSRMLADSAHFIRKEEVVGFDDHEKKLLEWVAEDAEPQRTLIAVCGMGGIGKTTLVTRVYKEVATSHFEYAAWVAVSHGFTTDDLLGKILKELRRNSGATSLNAESDTDADYRSLMAAVQGHLCKRKYLVVLDDVWDAHLWGKLLHLAFPDDAAGSRVVITTRSNQVAKAATLDRTMMLEPLQWHEAWTLFCNVTFRDVPNRTCPSHLEGIATNMLKRCHGLPMAIVSISKLLALRQRTEFAWRNACNNLVWDKSSDDLGIGEAASILNLSIDDLPHHLKKCFLSCSVYPEDLWLKRKILIRRWVALGLVQDKPGHCSAEDVADEYLDQLIQRNLMHPVAKNEFGRANVVSFMILSGSSLSTGPEKRNGTGDLQCARLLTVLNLWFIEMKKLPDSVTNLHNLRYLGRLARGKLPSWTCFLTSLMQLRLHGSHVAQDSLMLLAALPRLVNLSLISAYHERSMNFGPGSFPTLRKLTLEDLPNLNHVEFQEGCLVNLRDLVLGLCTQLTETPTGMKNLVHVQNLELYGMPKEFVAMLKEQNCAADYHNPASSDFIRHLGFRDL
ncbi:hypothetical protein PR202_ga25390 [Eleusine coracana subsp. coracana]|uniref:Uncharacterized protein n=1 Tax=Eleusine coracana subsp. coracana TaxID=191504 RepID=A0AAV5DAX7_ELECO|nr:hypothetical protein PR202_ga25390 [Eleusine coracana subsp. coracana]